MKMLLICGVLLMFTGSAVGLFTGGSYCRYPVCYGALGRPLYMQVPPDEYINIKKIYSKTSKEQIFRLDGKTIKQNHSDPRWQFVPENRTMIITSAEKEDSGKYKIEGRSPWGVGKIQFYLIIEAVVSSVEVMYSCFSSENRKVHCYSDGDQTQFSWTLNGIPHDQNLTDGNQTLLLDKDYTGNVTCHVENHVSGGDRTVELDRWSDPSALSRLMESGLMVFVSVWLFEVIILVSLLVGGFYIYTRIYRKMKSAESKEEKGKEPL